MASKIRPDDWDRLFAPNAPRRGGPLAALAVVLLVGLLIGLLGAAGVLAVDYRNQQIAHAIATATAVAPTRAALLTATAQAEQQALATNTALRTATAIAHQSTATLGIGVVTNGGNLRREPRVVADTVIGQIIAGDQVMFLEERMVGGETWFRIRLTNPVGNRGATAAPAGAEGWASATLLSQPTPMPTP